MRETEFFPVQNKQEKALIEGTPGFTPSMYQFINGGIDHQALAKHIRGKELRPVRSGRK